MLYLLAAILFSSLFSIIFKICQQKRIDSSLVLFFNYLTALVFSIVPIIITILSGNIGAGQDGVDMTSTVSLSDFSLPGISVAFALLQGFFFLAGFVIMDRSVWRSGVALTTVAARSSLVLSLILSWAMLGQSAPRWFPVGIVFAAIFLIILPTKTIQHKDVVLTSKTDEQRTRRAIILLFSLFILYGLSDFCLKLTQHTVESRFVDESLEMHLSSLTAVIFASASFFSLIYCFARRSFSKFGLKAITGGIALGVANCLCTSCCLHALGAMSTSVYYPVYNIGIVAVSALAGVLFFKEKLNWIQISGLVLAASGITLLFSF